MTEIAAANFPPVAAAAGAPAAKALSVRQLTWRKFKRNRLAMVGLVVLTVMYLMAALAGFIAPYGDRETHSEFARLAPHGLNFVDSDGQFHLVPFVYGLTRAMDRETFKMTLTVDTSQRYQLRLFVRGAP